MPKIRTVQEIQDEITQCIGFFPPYFEPALETPAVLENLWQQTLSAYLTNVIPPVFKEKLGLMLGRYLALSYCVLCHSSTLNPLGVKGADILKILNRPMPNLDELPAPLLFLKKLPDQLWPEAGSDLEDVLLEAAIVIFFEQDDGRTAERLKEILSISFFNHLIMLICYYRSSMQWVKVHSQISYENDQRYRRYYQRIIEEEPALETYVQNFLLAAKEPGPRSTLRVRESDKDRQQIIAERDMALKLLRQEKDWLAQIVDIAPFAISMQSGPERRYVIANGAFCKMTGKESHEVLGKTTQEVFPALTRGSGWESFNRIWTDGKRMDLPEQVFDRPDSDDKRYFQIIRQAKRAEGGAIEGVLTFSLEISDQVKAKQAMESQKLWLESILNRMPVGLVLVKAGSGSLLLSNEVANRMMGESLPADESEEFYSRLIDIRDSKGHRLSYNEFPSTRAARGEVIRDEIVLWKTKQGDYYVCVNADPLPPVFGHPAAVVVALHDITAAKLSELAIERSRQAAERSESRLMMAVEASQLGFWEYDLETQQVEWSETFRKLFDFPEGQYEGSYASTLAKIHPDDRSRVEAALGVEQPIHLVYRVVSTAGKVTWIEGRGRYQYDEAGKLTMMHGTCLDVTETKNVQDELHLAKDKAERANEAKSSFLANMSHEIRTPLTAIMGYTDLLKEEDLSPVERSGFIDIINRNGKALTKLIEDILDLSKVEAGKLLTENEHFSLEALLADVLFIFNDSARKKGIGLFSSLAEGTPDFLITDAVRLRQILVNIVGNAVKFTSEGYVRISSRVEKRKDGNLLEIEVEDSGIGLSEEEKERLFQPFVQADNSTSRRYGGTGLGLALSRRLAAALGGNISILKSEPSKGSRFLIAIQIDIAEDSGDELKPMESLNLHRDVLHGVRVLLVEDAPDNSLLISNMLAYYGAEVDTADNGRDGVDKALAGSFDVVLMDIQMPLMDGYEAFQRLKAHAFQAPILALTAHAMPEERKRTHQLGFVAHITKPIDPIELISSIHRFAKLHRRMQSIDLY